MSVTNDDRRRVELLEIISKRGLKTLSLEELKDLTQLVEKKDYSHDKKANKSRMKLLAQIHSRIYDLEENTWFRYSKCRNHTTYENQQNNFKHPIKYSEKKFSMCSKTR